MAGKNISEAELINQETGGKFKALPGRVTSITFPNLTKTVVIRLQHFKDFGPTEFARDLLMVRKHLAKSRARDIESILLTVRACSTSRHAMAFETIESYINLQGLSDQTARL